MGEMKKEAGLALRGAVEFIARRRRTGIAEPPWPRLALGGQGGTSAERDRCICLSVSKGRGRLSLDRRGA